MSCLLRSQGREAPPPRTLLRAAAELDGASLNLDWAAHHAARVQLHLDGVQRLLEAVPVTSKVHVREGAPCRESVRTSEKHDKFW